MWREAGVTCADFGVQDSAAFVKEHDLGKLFPSEEMDKLVAALIEEGASDDDVIDKVEAKAKELECSVDRTGRVALSGHRTVGLLGFSRFPLD